jgi:hypothetical protein
MDSGSSGGVQDLKSVADTPIPCMDTLSFDFLCVHWWTVALLRYPLYRDSTQSGLGDDARIFEEGSWPCGRHTLWKQSFEIKSSFRLFLPCPNPEGKDPCGQLELVFLFA